VPATGSQPAMESEFSFQVKVYAPIKVELGSAKERESRLLSPVHAMNCFGRAGRFAIKMTGSCVIVMRLSNREPPKPSAAV